MNNTSNPENKMQIKTAKILSADSEFQSEDVPLKSADMQSDFSNVTVIEEDGIHHTNLEEVEDELELPLPKSKSTVRKWLLGLSGLVAVASIVEFVIFINEMLQQRDWLAAVWLTIFSGLVVVVAKLIWQEWRGLKNVKNQQQSRKVSEYMFYSPAIGSAETHCMKMAAHLPNHHQKQVIAWQEKLEDHLTDNEVLSLFEQQVLVPIDKLAIRTLTKNASASGVMIAVSPFALLDMLIVLWRNVRMINQLSEIYGVRVGYWGRVKLIKNIFHSMVYAGAAEILSDAGNYALGAGITGKLSSRIAQGLGASVLTARIGLKAIQECRPMPCLSVDKPNLTSMTKQLLTELNNKIR